MIKAVIFDFDGVIGKSEESRFAIFKNIFKHKGLPLPNDAFQKMVGRTTKVFLQEITIKGLTPEVKEEIREAYNKEYKGNIVAQVKPVTPIVDFIKSYNGYLKLAVASGSDVNILQVLTTHFGIYHKFYTFIGKESVSPHFKPHPESYLKAAEALGVSPYECIVIEDSMVGVQAALAAGAVCYVFLNGLNSKEEFANMPIAGFVETEADLEKLVL